MRLKQTILKFINNKNILSLLAFLLVGYSYGQEVITVDSTGVAKQEPSVAVTPPSDFKRFKAEGVSGVVGDYVILDSDIDKSYIELKSQGIPIEDVTRCQLLGKLLEDKLYAHQAKQDSIFVSDEEINQQTEQQLSYIISELGSEEKAVAYYRKDNLTELRTELFEVNKTLKLASEMQRTIIENVEVTPEEVRQFFYDIPEEERPVFGAELEIAQLVVEPKVTEEARQKVIDRLAQFRADILENGSSFATKAVLYSKDGTSAKGGLIPGIKRSSPLAKEFKDQVFSLTEGEISEPFETEFGFHIVYVEKIRGQEVDARHIILFPEVSQATIEEAQKRIDTIRSGIVSGKATFAAAARAYSDDSETKNNGGQLVNPATSDTKFDLTKMDPTLSAQVYNLKEGEVTQVFTDRDYTGRSKFKILTVTNRIEEHPADYVKDYEKIKQLALREKQIREIEKWQSKKIKETYVSINDDYQECEFSSNWLKK